MTQDKQLLKARQIKAARALIDWSQDDLAKASGLSVATIRKIELGEISPRSVTNESILRALEEAGLEFLSPDGVRHRPDEITIYEGQEGFLSFFDDVYTTMKKKGGNVIVVCASEVPFANGLSAEDGKHIARMAALRDRTTVQCILTEDTTQVPASAYCEYRAISKAYVDSVPFYVYDNKYAIIVFGETAPFKITVIESRIVADAFRRQFASMWEKATLLSRPPSLPNQVRSEKGRRS